MYTENYERNAQNAVSKFAKDVLGIDIDPKDVFIEWDSEITIGWCGDDTDDYIIGFYDDLTFFFEDENTVSYCADDEGCTHGRMADYGIHE